LTDIGGDDPVLRLFIAILASIVGFWTTLTPALAERMVAFVVGIDKYDNLGPHQQLERAVNDARSVSAAFASLGFEVVHPENVGRGAFNAEWQKFLDKLQPDSTAAIYFSGHGVEIEGLNFLLPRDVPNISYGRQEQLKRESLSVSELLLDLRKRKPQVTLVILDACRDNPLIPQEERSLAFGHGLARMDAPAGTFIMYSAGVGETALDRLPVSDPDKVNSVYTRKLLPLMKSPGLPLHELARELRLEVNDLAAAVPHVQQPAYYDGLIGKFCLAGCRSTPAPESPSAALPRSSAPSSAEWEEAERDWQQYWSRTTDIQMLEAFKEMHKAVPQYVRLAETRIEELRRAEAARRAALAAWQREPEETKKRVSDLADAMQKLDEEAAARQRLGPRCEGIEITVGQNERRCFKPGAGKTESFKDCPDCPEMVVVPSGSFIMGSPANEPARSSGEVQTRVSIPAPFAVGRFAVTFDEWDACVAGRGCHGYADQGWGRGKRPVINVNWDDARAYAAWVSRKTGKTYGLLSEAEREYVTRAGTRTPFWWGNSITPQQANYDGTAEPYRGGGWSAKGEYRKRTMPVDTFEPNPWGLYQVHGNVWDWTEDCWNDSNTGNPGNGTARITGECGRRVVRGGSWYLNPEDLRSGARTGALAATRSEFQGFRLARTLDP
jgi:formylglycine-generating enzyme required for sulfatase activity